MFILILLLRLIGVACVFGAVMIHMELALAGCCSMTRRKIPISRCLRL